MSGTTNLNAPLVVASQNQKEVTINAAFARFDAAISETFDADLASGNVTVTSEQGRACLMVRATNVATSGRTVTLPQVERVFLVSNPAASSDDVGFVRGSTTVTLAPGETATVRTDGTTDGLVVLVLGSASGGGGSGGVTIEDEGTTVTGGPHTTLNFTGAGVSVADAGSGEATVTISGGSGGVTIEDEGTTVTGGPHTTLNFTGAGVSVADAGSGEATVTISGGGAGEQTGRTHVIPVVADFTWVNQSTATATDRSYGISFKKPSSTGQDQSMLVKSAPATPYEVRIRFEESRPMIDNMTLIFGWRNSGSGNLQHALLYYGTGENRLGVFNYGSPTGGFAGNPVAPVAQSHRTGWVKLADDGTDRTAWVSSDGDEWALVATLLRTNYITPDQVLFGVDNPRGSTGLQPVTMTILSWEEL